MYDITHRKRWEAISFWGDDIRPPLSCLFFVVCCLLKNADKGRGLPKLGELNKM
jgi:hypothetical protein